MAFATANTSHDRMGSMRIFYGDWSGSQGDSAGTVTLKGGRVYSASFQDQDSDYGEKVTPCSVSVSSGTITITVYNKNAVSSGRFMIYYK